MPFSPKAMNTLDGRVAMKIDESRCTGCGLVARNMHGTDYPDEWYLNDKGELVCDECYDRILDTPDTFQRTNG